MIRAVLRGIALWLLLASLCIGQSADEAVRSLASKLSARLAPGASARVTVRNLSSATEAEAAAIRTSLERALQHGGSNSAAVAAVALTISQNVREFLLIAEFERNGEQAVDIVSYQPDPGLKAARPVLEKRLLWEQRNPILDVAVFQDRLFILEPQRLSVYGRQGVEWQMANSKELDAAPTVRDLRGRLEVSDESITAIYPGRVCRGAAVPDIRCEAGDASFAIAGEKARFTGGRNTIEAAGFPPLFSIARIADTSGALFLAAGADGRTRLYDGSKRAVDAINGWGSDVVSPASGCAANRIVMVTWAAESDAVDSITAFTVVNRKPSQAGPPAEFEGAITALWPEGDGAVAVVHNSKTGTYAAYFVTTDCGP
jgi:hypothetical protein